MASKVDLHASPSIQSAGSAPVSSNSKNFLDLFSYMNPWSRAQSSVGAVQHAVTTRCSEANIRTIWTNTFTQPPFRWASSQTECNPGSKTLQRTDRFGTVSIQECYPIQAAETFQMNFAPSIGIMVGTLVNCLVMYNGYYWISAEFENQMGLLKFSVDGSSATQFYPLSDAQLLEYRLIPSCSEGNVVVCVHGDSEYYGFSILDFSSEVPTSLLEVGQYESQTLRIGNNRLIGFRTENNRGILELWDLKSRTKTWEFNDPDWFKRGGGLYFCFGSYIPEMHLLIGDSGKEVYGIDIEARKVLWHAQICTEGDMLTLKHPVANKFLVCRAASSPMVKVHSLQNGAFLAGFEIGKNLKFDSDGFPMVFIGDQVIALDPKDNRQLVRIDLNTGKTNLKFDVILQDVCELALAGSRVIGLYRNDNQNPSDQTAMYVWDIESGKLLFTRSWNPKAIIEIADVSDGLVTILSTKDPEELQKPRKMLKEKSVGRKAPITQVKSGPILPVDQLNFEIWDLNAFKMIGTITENLVGAAKSDYVEYSFREGQLIVNWTVNNAEIFFKKQYNWDALKQSIKPILKTPGE